MFIYIPAPLVVTNTTTLKGEVVTLSETKYFVPSNLSPIHGGNNVLFKAYKLKHGKLASDTPQVILKAFLGENGYAAYLNNKAVYEANTSHNWEHITEIYDYSEAKVTIGKHSGYVVALERYVEMNVIVNFMKSMK